jgi:acyl-CoA reductase-like NAD-dependent aldehyde dehydrogenase
MEKLVLGDGFQEGVTQGPLINLSQFKKVNIIVADS